MAASARSKPSALVIAAIVLIALTGLIHLFEAPEYFEEQFYIGVLFVLNAIACGVVAALLWRGDSRAWALGALVAAGSVIAYVLSRTTGLPGFYRSEWAEPLGILSLVVEAAFLIVAAPALQSARAAPAR